jgi:hypothetical protein
MPTFGGTYASHVGRNPPRKRVKGSQAIVLAARSRATRFETLGVGVIANRLAMGRVTVDRLVGKMAA